jgi:hypothetical protein
MMTLPSWAPRQRASSPHTERVWGLVRLSPLIWSSLSVKRPTVKRISVARRAAKRLSLPPADPPRAATFGPATRLNRSAVCLPKVGNSSNIIGPSVGRRGRGGRDCHVRFAAMGAREKCARAYSAQLTKG